MPWWHLSFVLFFSAFVVVQSVSRVRLVATPWTAAHHASLSLTISWSLLKLMSIESVMSSNHLVLCHALLQPSIFPASGAFLMSQIFTLGGQSIGASASASILLMNIQDWLPLGLTAWSPCSPRDSWKSSPTPQFKSINSSVLSLLYGPTLTSIYDYQKNHSFDYTDYFQENNVSAFYLMSRFVTVFVPRSKRLLISWLQSPSAVILETKNIKSETVSIVSPSICCEMMERGTMMFVFWMLSFKPAFSLSCFTFIKRLFSSFSFYAIRVVSSS